MRVLIIGYGSIGKQHHKSVLRVFGEDSCKVALLRRQRDDTLDTLQFTALGAAQAWRPNIVIIASPASLHIEHYLAFYKLDSIEGILVEKPLCRDIQQIKSLSKWFPKTIVGFDMRQLPVMQSLKRIICQGKLGTVQGVHVRVGQALPSWRNSSDFRQDVSAQKALGGGVIRELSHELDYLGYLGFEFSSIFARTSSSQWLQLEVEDSAQIQADLVYNDRLLPAMIELDMLSDESFRECRVEFSDGRVTVDFIASKVCFEQYGGDIETTLMPPVHPPIDIQLNALLGNWNVINEALNVCSIEEAINTMRIIKVIEQSVRDCQRVGFEAL